MSYYIELADPVTGEVLELDSPHHMRGGTYQVGGTTKARLNITYNYYLHFYKVFGELTQPRKRTPQWLRKTLQTIDGIRTLYGLSGAESIPILDEAIAKLGDDVDPDYWKSTEGNAKRALVQLRALATMRPDGIWTGD